MTVLNYCFLTIYTRFFEVLILVKILVYYWYHLSFPMRSTMALFFAFIFIDFKIFYTFLDFECPKDFSITTHSLSQNRFLYLLTYFLYYLLLQSCEYFVVNHFILYTFFLFLQQFLQFVCPSMFNFLIRPFYIISFATNLSYMLLFKVNDHNQHRPYESICFPHHFWGVKAAKTNNKKVPMTK